MKVLFVFSCVHQDGATVLTQGNRLVSGLSAFSTTAKIFPWSGPTELWYWPAWDQAHPFLILRSLSCVSTQVTEYMKSGGDGFESLTRGKTIKTSDLKISEIVTRSLMAKKEIAPRIEGRVRYFDERHNPHDV